MALTDVTEWMDEFGRPGFVWYAKRLSANDTLATGGHQAGPYVPKECLFDIFPTLNNPQAENPDHRFNLYIDSHSDHRMVRAVWYNNRVRGQGTRNRDAVDWVRRAHSRALLDPDSTGCTLLFCICSQAPMVQLQTATFGLSARDGRGSFRRTPWTRRTEDIYDLDAGSRSNS